MKKRAFLSLILALALVFSFSAQVLAAETGAASEPIDYSDPENWAYFAQGEDSGIDVFVICPTVDTRSETNSFDLNDKLKARFVNALEMGRGIYQDAGRVYSPYYRQMSINAYTLDEEPRAAAFEVARADVFDSFRWYLDNENEGRALILAGFSQGSQMCLELLKEFYGGESDEAEALRSGLVAVYAIGWSVTEDLTEEYPQIVPAKGETDTGTVISFDCEDGSLTGTLVTPEGTKALSINPLNWKTDGTPADKSLNLGAVMATGAEPVPGYCGGYLGERGELVVTDIDPSDYPPGVDIFPQGSLHVYDYLFYFTNLKNNLADRVNCFKTGLPFKDVKDGAWYEDAVAWAYEKGLIQGTSDVSFSPQQTLTRAQLVTMLWRMAGEPVVNYIMPYGDVATGSWYAEAVRWAAAEKLAGPGNGSFRPSEALTREETADILCRYAAYAGADTEISSPVDISSFSDTASISGDYLDSVKWAVDTGIIEGMGDGRLAPKGQLTRAQAAVMLERFSALLRSRSPLSLWTEGSEAARELTDYIKTVTDEDSADFIPAEDRIAVFDLDGTLFCETDPNYFDYTLLKYRVLEDPGYKDKASDFEKEVANKIKQQNETGASFPGLEVDHGKAVASAFAGMTIEEFNDYIQEFKKQPMPSYEGMLRGDGFYLPMVQVVEYLQENGFTVYIVSGTDRLIVRGIIDNSVLNIPNRQIIGSDETIISSNQGDTDGLNYVFAEGEELVLGGDFIIKNLKMNKVSVIMQEIGQQPVLSFGNSTGDSSMAEYVTSGNPYRSLAFMLCCDDTERENGSVSKAEKMFGLCEEFGWVPVSMKNDWTTIYGEGVKYVKAEEALDPAA
ncbi:MAG: DUF3089 domain-containing protein [Firmicutes bacterium]|nr:DUF3089 domain-containing protein [Bacillota bacterium]